MYNLLPFKVRCSSGTVGFSPIFCIYLYIVLNLENIPIRSSSTALLCTLCQFYTVWLLLFLWGREFPVFILTQQREGHWPVHHGNSLLCSELSNPLLSLCICIKGSTHTCRIHAWSSVVNWKPVERDQDRGYRPKFSYETTTWSHEMVKTRTRSVTVVKNMNCSFKRNLTWQPQQVKAELHNWIYLFV